MVDRMDSAGGLAGLRLVVIIVLGLLAIAPWVVVDIWVWDAVLGSPSAGTG